MGELDLAAIKKRSVSGVIALTSRTFFLQIVNFFSMFLLIYSAQKSITYFFVAFALFRAVDFIWMWRIRREYTLFANDTIFFNTWLKFEGVEALVALGFAAFAANFSTQALYLLLGFVVFRIVMRILASFRYKKIHFA